MKNIKNFGDFVNESYSILEGKDHKFADDAFRKITDKFLSDSYDVSDEFYNKIITLAHAYFKKNSDGDVDKFISSEKNKLDKLIAGEKKKGEKQKKKELKSSKKKDYEKEDITDDDMKDLEDDEEEY